MSDTQVLAVASRILTSTETLELTSTEIATLSSGLKSGMFITQSDGVNKANYKLFSSKNTMQSIDGVIAFDVVKAVLKEGENIIQRVAKGNLYNTVIEAANGVKITDEAVNGVTYKTLLEKQGFEIVACTNANTI